MRIKHSLLLALFANLTLTLFSQKNIWTDVSEALLRNTEEERWIVPSQYRTLELDVEGMGNLLQQAPRRFNEEGTSQSLSLPMPDGTTETFLIQESPLLERAYVTKNIRTYAGVGQSDPNLAVYLDFTPTGFHAMVIGPGKAVFIDPYFEDNRTHYVCYDKQHLVPAEDLTFSCGFQPNEEENLPSANMTPVSGQRSAAISLRTYKIAIAATGEYTQFHGSAANALAAITTTLNRVRGIYETELAVSFTLVSNNSSIIYTDPATDPYSASPTLAENQSNIDNVIGSANYDIGHLVDIGSGGVAGLGVTCGSIKAWGITANASPKSDPFDVDFVAHEIGHQFGANHTFNGNQGSCGGSNRNAATAYEPGSGNTIMGYAGICGTDNIQWNSESHFHFASIEQITNYVTVGNGSTCGTVTSSGNNSPTVNANAENIHGKYIPINTPFELTASGSDPDGNSISYSWEQLDLGSAGAPSSSADGPIFRSFLPSSSPTRTFPRLSDILDNSGSPAEFLPSIARDLNFKCTVRDVQAGGGGTGSDAITLHVTNSADGFAIASHNSLANVEGAITINWNVANTTASPVNCAHVDIMVSTDGGHHFTTLVSGTANDGSQEIVLPGTATGQGRIKVKCSDNVFFDINNADLRIVPAAATCAERVSSGDFGNTSAWNQSSSNMQQLIANWGAGYAYSGTNSAWLGYLPNETSRVSQTINIPAGQHFAKLEFWYKLLKFHCGGDMFRVKVNGSVVETISLCNNDAAVDWKRHLIDLSSYMGTSPTIMFELVTDADHQTDVLLDAVSVYTCEGGQFALPVELSDFQAIAVENDAELTWITQSETNNVGFEIEQYNKHGEYEKIGFVTGNGTTASAHNYHFQVRNLSPGIHYFRLRQMDTDGAYSYSPVRSVRIDGDFEVGVFPNPASEVVFFEFNLTKEENIRLEVFNLNGQRMGLITNERFAKGTFQLPFEVEGLPAGIYFYRLQGEGVTKSGRFTVER